MFLFFQMMTVFPLIMYLLRVSVLYSEGGLRLSWERAVARAVVGGQLRVRTAVEYHVRLLTPGGGKYMSCHDTVVIRILTQICSAT